MITALEGNIPPLRLVPIKNDLPCSMHLSIRATDSAAVLSVGRSASIQNYLAAVNEMEEGSISKPNLSPTAWQCFSLRSPAEEVKERCLRDFEVLQQLVWTPTRRSAEPPEVVCSTFSHPTESKSAAFTVHHGCEACKSPDLRTRIQDGRSKSLGKSMSTTRAGALSNTKASRSTHSSTKRASNARHSR
jgi:hypothetical protein